MRQRAARPHCCTDSAPAFWTRAVLPANQAYTLQRYDSLGRTVEVRQPGATLAATVQYDGRTTTYRDENSHQRVETQDAFGRLVRVDQYTGNGAGQPYALYATTQYGYDVTDRLKLVTPPAALPPTEISYDLLGRKLSITDPDLGTWRYTYDASGNLQSQTDARGIGLWFGYDGLNRRRAKREGSATGRLLAEYFYDEPGAGAGQGRRTRMVASAPSDDGLISSPNSARWAYDARGRVTAETVTINDQSCTTGYGYDAADRVRSRRLVDAG